MYRDLLVPLDGSEFSEQALPWAIALARRAGGRIHVVLVHTPLSRYAVDLAPVRVYDEWEHSARRREAEYLEGRMVELRWRGVEALAESLEGDAAERLIERAARGIDLVVMATHGRAGLERAWMGSVAEDVVHHVRLPVLLVRPEQDVPIPEEPEPRMILAATDGSTAAEAACLHAAELARRFEAALTVIRVVSSPSGLTSPYLPHAAIEDREQTIEREDEAERDLADLATRIGDGLRVETRTFRAHHAARGIVNAAGQLGADVVVVGTHRRTRLARVVLGSVADKVIRASPVPVMVGHAST